MGSLPQVPPLEGMTPLGLPQSSKRTLVLALSPGFCDACGAEYLSMDEVELIEGAAHCVGACE
jgi:hypothetical protein